MNTTVNESSSVSAYAIVENGVVVNLILWDGQTEWAAPTGSSAIQVPSNAVVDIGYTYNGTTFAAPPIA